MKVKGSLYWIYSFTSGCKGKMLVAILLAVIGVLCGMAPYGPAEQHEDLSLPPADPKPVFPARCQQQDEGREQQGQETGHAGRQDTDRRQRDTAGHCQQQSRPALPAAGVEPEGIYHGIAQGDINGVKGDRLRPG